MYDFQALKQIGINNIQVARQVGIQISIYEERLLDQFAKAEYADQKLRELVINAEISKYDGFDTYTGQDAPDNFDPKGDGGDSQPT